LYYTCICKVGENRVQSEFLVHTGASVSNLGDSVMILHVAFNDPKQKVSKPGFTGCV